MDRELFDMLEDSPNIEAETKEKATEAAYIYKQLVNITEGNEIQSNTIEDF